MMTKEEIGRVIKNARLTAGYTQSQVASQLGRPQQTIANWEVGRSQPDANTLFELFQVLGADLNTAFGFSTETKKSPSLSDEAQKVAARYSKLDRFGKAAVQAVMGEEEARIKEQAEMDEILTKTKPKVIPLYWTPAAAGYASPALGEDYDNYTLTPEDPQGAVFAIKVQGDSMEPHFPDGSIAFCNHDPIADGDVGVFCLDGENFIKQYYYDRMMGMTYLFSLNRDRADADKLITRTSGQTLTCFGRVITRRRYPLPR